MLLAKGVYQVLLFDGAGQLVRSMGRLGSGPGEFSEPTYLRVRNDTIEVWERRFGPVIAFDTGGTFLGQRHIDFARVLDAHGLAGNQQLGPPLPDGSFITRVNPHAVPQLGVVYRHPVAYVHLRRDYSAKVLGWYEKIETLRPEASTSVLTLPVHPLFPAASTVEAGGDPVHIYASNADTSGVRVFDEDGDLVRIIRLDRPPIPITERERNVQHTWIADLNSTPQTRARFENTLRMVPPQTHYPPMRGLKVDRAGYLWSLDKSDRVSSEWSVFDPSGAWIGRVHVPLLTIYDIGEDFILGSTQDDMLVETVHVYELFRGP